jgi:hypothetical protein
VDLLENYLPRLVGSPQMRDLLKQNVLTEAQRSNAIAELKTLENSEKLSTSSRKNLIDLREILTRQNL